MRVNGKLYWICLPLRFMQNISRFGSTTSTTYSLMVVSMHEINLLNRNYLHMYYRIFFVLYNLIDLLIFSSIVIMPLIVYLITPFWRKTYILKLFYIFTKESRSLVTSPVTWGVNEINLIMKSPRRITQITLICSCKHSSFKKVPQIIGRDTNI